MKKASGRAPLPNYKKPPINEVVCGIVFEPLASFKVPYFGLLWAKVRDQFPTCEHAHPLGSGSQVPHLDVATGLVLPRVWLIDKSGNTLVQVQNDRSYFNWRSRAEQDAYPRYSEIFRSAQVFWDVFFGFAREHGLGEIKPVECELTYINHVPRGQGWDSAEEISNVLPDFAWRKAKDRFLPNPRDFAWQVSFPLPKNLGRLDAKLRQIRRKSDSLPALYLELSARGLGDDKSLEAIWNWFSVAHEWIVRGFADLTSIQVQKTIWEREQ